MRSCLLRLHFFFFNDTATTEIYTLSLHDALPISRRPPDRLGASPRRLGRQSLAGQRPAGRGGADHSPGQAGAGPGGDRKSTRLNSSHANISYAVFCLKKKKKTEEVVTTVTSSNS